MAIPKLSILCSHYVHIISHMSSKANVRNVLHVLADRFVAGGR